MVHVYKYNIISKTTVYQWYQLVLQYVLLAYVHVYKYNIISKTTTMVPWYHGTHVRTMVRTTRLRLLHGGIATMW